jgi:DNA-binding transcriptional ArsR family regulator
VGFFEDPVQITRHATIALTTPGLTRKYLLTYIGDMAVTSDREQDVFGAISHPARRRMLDLLVEADRSVNTIAGHFQMSRPAVSQHLRVLLDAGLVTEQRRGRERRYQLVPAGLGLVRDWIAHYEQFWDDRLQRLKNHLMTKGDEK